MAYGCNLTTDNMYTSIELTEYLLEKKMTLIETMRVNRKGVEQEHEVTDWEGGEHIH